MKNGTDHATLLDSLQKKYNKQSKELAETKKELQELKEMFTSFKSRFDDFEVANTSQMKEFKTTLNTSIEYSQALPINALCNGYKQKYVNEDTDAEDLATTAIVAGMCFFEEDLKEQQNANFHSMKTRMKINRIQAWCQETIADLKPYETKAYVKQYHLDHSDLEEFDQ